MLDELDLSIDISSEYIVLTRDVATDDPNLSAIGTSKKEFVSMLESQNIYLNVIDKDFDTEIVVTMVSSTIILLSFIPSAFTNDKIIFIIHAFD